MIKVKRVIKKKKLNEEGSIKSGLTLTYKSHSRHNEIVVLRSAKEEDSYREGNNI